jgi:hypothetical protein
MLSPISRTGCAPRPATLRCVEGAQAAGNGDGGQVIVEGAPVSTGRESRVTEAGDYRFFAGWRSDPFFLDRRGTLNNLQFTGNDYFADQDVCSIVLEVPNAALGTKEVGLWHRTLVPAHGAGGVGLRLSRPRNSIAPPPGFARWRRCWARTAPQSWLNLAMARMTSLGSNASRSSINHRSVDCGKTSRSLISVSSGLISGRGHSNQGVC